MREPVTPSCLFLQKIGGSRKLLVLLHSSHTTCLLLFSNVIATFLLYCAHDLSVQAVCGLRAACGQQVLHWRFISANFHIRILRFCRYGQKPKYLKRKVQKDSDVFKAVTAKFPRLKDGDVYVVHAPLLLGLTFPSCNRSHVVVHLPTSLPPSILLLISPSS